MAAANHDRCHRRRHDLRLRRLAPRVAFHRRAVYLSGGSQAKLADYTVTNFGTVEFGTTPDNK